MFNQRNNPFTRGQNNNNNQQRPPPQQPQQQIYPNINNFETINVPNGVTTYISNRRNGNQWEHTEYETQPVPQEIQRQQHNDELNYQYNVQVLDHQNEDRQNERNNDYRVAIMQTNDRQNQRNHEYAMHRIENINQITNARIAEANARVQQQIAMRQGYINNPTVRNPVGNEFYAQQIVNAATLVNYNINANNPRDVFISNEFVEPDLRENLYSHTVFFAGVEDIDHQQRHLKIMFTDNRVNPITFRNINGRYYKVIRSINLPHLILVRVYITPASIRSNDSIISKVCPVLNDKCLVI